MPRLLSLVIGLLLAGTTVAGEWPGWRGPTGNGVAAPGEYPVTWTGEDNIAWQIDLPGAGASTPCVTAEHIVVTGPREGANSVDCYSRQGKLQWSTAVGKDVGGKHKKASGANPSPTTNGKLVFAYFKSGDLAALDFKGQIVWQLNLQEKFGASDLWWDLGTSPVLTARHLVVAVMQTANSYLVAFDPATGELAWKVDRNLGAPEEAGQSYSTPAVFNYNGDEQLVLVGGDHVTCHSAADGHELWRVSGLNPEQNKFFRSIAGPVVSDGIAVAPYGRGDTVTGIRLGGSGDVSTSHVVWHKTDAGSDVPTPAAVNGKFYVCRDKAAQVVCRNVATGEVEWQQQLPKNRNAFSSSPVLAGGRIYCTREDGVTFVLDAATGKIESENPLAEEEFTVATPVAVDGQILLRTFKRLYCIGKK
jgi:outer membrane protein assembly factor BamB